MCKHVHVLGCSSHLQGQQRRHLLLPSFCPSLLIPPLPPFAPPCSATLWEPSARMALQFQRYPGTLFSPFAGRKRVLRAWGCGTGEGWKKGGPLAYFSPPS